VSAPTAAPASAPLPSPWAERGAVAAVLLLLPLLLLWPLPRLGTGEVLAAPGYEAAAHLWGLWAALHLGQPLVLHTGLLAAPQGVDMVLVDPVNLPWFALGQALGGPALGFDAVAWGGLLVAGLAGALLAVEVQGRPWVGALAAMVAPPLLCAPGDGLTEDLAVGWVALQLALTLRFLRTGQPATGLAATLALGACAWGGPYNGLLAGLVDLGLVLGQLRRPRALVRLAVVGLGGAALASPVAWAILARRAATLPGAAARATLPAAELAVDRFRGGLMTGIDLLDPWLPAPLTGGVPPVPHTGYLGLVALAVSVVVVARDRRRWPWLVGALGLTALALGPHLSLAGQPLRLGGAPLLGPAGLLIQALPAAGRLTRWYRSSAVAALLLVPLLARAARGGPRRSLPLAAALVVDALLLAPVAWPRPHAALPDAAAWAQLPSPGAEPGAILDLPLSTSGTPRAGDWRDAGPAGQVLHGRPIGGAMMGLAPSPEARQGQRLVQELLRGAPVDPAALARLRRQGFAFVAIRTDYLPLGLEGGARLDAALGPAVVDEASLRVHRLRLPSAEVPDPSREPRAPRVDTADRRQ